MGRMDGFLLVPRYSAVLLDPQILPIRCFEQGKQPFSAYEPDADGRRSRTPTAGSSWPSLQPVQPT